MEAQMTLDDLEKQNFSNSVFISGQTGAFIQIGQKAQQQELQQQKVKSLNKRRGRGQNKDHINFSETLQTSKTPKKTQNNVSKKGIKVGRAPRSSSAKAKGTSLKDLLEAGLLLPGEGKLTINYRNQLYVGALSIDGIIFFDGREFQSPSAFSVYAKRKLTPEKQGDDGWRSVHYEGSTLDSYRKKLIQQQSNG